MMTSILSICLLAPFAPPALSLRDVVEAERPQTFSLPRQPLSAALLSFARQAGAELLLPHDPLTTWRSSAVSGDMTAEEALQRLLRCTPFEGRVSNGVVHVRRRDGEALGLALEPAAPPRGGQACPPDQADRPLLAIAAQSGSWPQSILISGDIGGFGDAPGAERRGGRA